MQVRAEAEQAKATRNPVEDPVNRAEEAVAAQQEVVHVNPHQEEDNVIRLCMRDCIC